MPDGNVDYERDLSSNVNHSFIFPLRGGTPCGVKPIKDVPGVENYDVTDMVESHTKYADALPNILQHVRFSEP